MPHQQSDPILICNVMCMLLSRDVNYFSGWPVPSLTQEGKVALYDSG